MRKLAKAAVLALALAGCGQASEQAAEEVNPPVASEPAAPAAEFCAEIGRRVSRADCEVFDLLAAQAEAGIAAFNAPDPMARGEEHTLQLAISFAPPAIVVAELPAPSNGALADDTRSAAEIIDALPGATVQFAPLVGRFMRAELVGAGFDIEPITPASQEVLADSVTTWSWRVIARQGGQRTLTLTTIVEGCSEAGQCYPLRSTSQNYQVEVSVGLLGQVQDFLAGVPAWIQILSGILGAIAGLAVAFFSLRSALRGRGG